MIGKGKTSTVFCIINQTRKESKKHKQFYLIQRKMRNEKKKKRWGGNSKKHMIPVFPDSHHQNEQCSVNSIYSYAGVCGCVDSKNRKEQINLTKRE
ncbi:hypothetical protein I7I48_01544 [Histoplasma ohiense]|nr:hypothetical protein I7I48_01544 [Histoplasma ohiense (nom. inval.)]